MCIRDSIRVEIDPDTGRFDVALIQDIVADEDWYDEHAEIGVTEARKIRSSYEVGDRIIKMCIRDRDVVFC